MTQPRPGLDLVGQHDLLGEIEAAIKARHGRLAFEPRLEAVFGDTRAEARRQTFGRLTVYGLLIYNSFLITDWFMLPDVFVEALVIQLGIVTPLAILIHNMLMRAWIEPDDGVVLCLVAMFIGIVALCHRSSSVNAPFLVFTFPCCLLFGNVVLPLSFKRAVAFTGICAAIGTASILTVDGLNTVLRVFSLLLFLSSAAYMLIATYRMEASERLGFLFTLRETIQVERLAENNRQLQTLSQTDGLTGVGNRRFFDTALDRLWGEPAGSGPRLGLILVDIDHFKRLNDTHGHLVGDICLKQVAERLRAEAGGHPDLFLARYGGEEFALLTTREEVDRSGAWAERIRSAIAAAPLRIGASGDEVAIPITVSAGFAVAAPDRFGAPADLIEAADSALYQAKRHGRNRVMAFTSETDGDLAAG